MNPLEVATLVDEFNVGPLVLQRAPKPAKNARGAYDDPIYVPQLLDPVALHTATGKDLEQVPEADRHRETLQLYTRERLYVGDDGTHAVDRIEWRSRTYRVIKVEDYEVQGGLYRVMAQLEDA